MFVHMWGVTTYYLHSEVVTLDMHMSDTPKHANVHAQYFVFFLFIYSFLNSDVQGDAQYVSIVTFQPCNIMFLTRTLLVLRQTLAHHILFLESFCSIEP